MLIWINIWHVPSENQKFFYFLLYVCLCLFQLNNFDRKKGYTAKKKTIYLGHENLRILGNEFFLNRIENSLLKSVDSHILYCADFFLSKQRNESMWKWIIVDGNDEPKFPCLMKSKDFCYNFLHLNESA